MRNFQHIDTAYGTFVYTVQIKNCVQNGVKVSENGIQKLVFPNQTLLS